MYRKATVDHINAPAIHNAIGQYVPDLAACVRIGNVVSLYECSTAKVLTILVIHNAKRAAAVVRCGEMVMVEWGDWNERTQTVKLDHEPCTVDTEYSVRL